MSAWYVLSSMGIYSVTPGNYDFRKKWTTIEPYFETIKVRVEDKIKIISKGSLIFNDFGFNVKRKLDMKNYSNQVVVPVIQSESKAFKDNLKIELKSSNSKDIIYYGISSIDNKPIQGLRIYKKPFYINESSIVSCFKKETVLSDFSNTISATFFKKPNNYSINIKSKYNPQYHAGGPEGLLDGILGTENWRKGDWQGYQSQDFEAVVDLQEAKDITEISARFLQDQRSWILMPTKVDYYVSEDNVNFTYFGSVANTLDPKIEENQIQNFTFSETKGKKVRYVKVIAKNFGKLPEWHQGAGGDAFIFVDEITIK
jgi:hypothetical protein